MSSGNSGALSVTAVTPNSSFNPNPLRSTNNMAGRACHVVGSTTQVGLTQALGASKPELKRFAASVASGGHSTRVVAGFGGRLRTLLSSRTQAAHRFARGLRLLCAARGRGGIVGPVGAASERSLLIVRGVRLVLQASVQAALRALHFRGMIAPNKSFKPNALRYTNNMAGRACHVVGSATHVGLTQQLS